MKKILIPTDFSACAENATSVALEIAKRAGAHLVFQHFFPDTSGSLHTLKADTQKDANVQQKEAVGRAKAKLDELVIRAEHLGLKATPLLVMNKGTDKIENYIEPLGINLVVMGSHGATGMRELILGTQTQRVVRHATAPVLVVKHKPDKIDFNNILFASTFHEDPSHVLDTPIALASLWNGTIHLVYVGLEKDQLTKAQVQEKMNVITNQFSMVSFTHNFIATNDPEWGIKHMTKDIEPDMIALTTELKTGAFIFSHSLAENLVNHETLPVLIMNSKN